MLFILNYFFNLEIVCRVPFSVSIHPLCSANKHRLWALPEANAQCVLRSSGKGFSAGHAYIGRKIERLAFVLPCQPLDRDVHRNRGMRNQHITPNLAAICAGIVGCVLAPLECSFFLG